MLPAILQVKISMPDLHFLIGFVPIKKLVNTAAYVEVNVFITLLSVSVSLFSSVLNPMLKIKTDKKKEKEKK